MKKLKVFHKIFIKTFSILVVLTLLIHAVGLYIFPSLYLKNRKHEITKKADEIAKSFEKKDIHFIKETMDIYSKNNEIKVNIKEGEGKDEIKIAEPDNIDFSSKNNSLIIEERDVLLDNGKNIRLQFLSNADMKKEAKKTIIKFLPYSIAISIMFSIIISLIYARTLTKNIKEILNVVDSMTKLDKNAHLKISSEDEIGQLKRQINDMYDKLLNVIDDLKFKNEEIVKLEKVKYNFFRGASHELKTPLTSLKIILENMKYNIGKYKDRDKYIEECIGIVDGLSKNIKEILLISSVEHLKNDEQMIKISESLDNVLKKYEVNISKKNLNIKNNIKDEEIYIGKAAFEMVLSNLISNAVRYSDDSGSIIIGIMDRDKNNDNGKYMYIENTYSEKEDLDIENIFDINFNSDKANSNGLGLYIVKNILNNYNLKCMCKKSDIGIMFLIECKK